MELGHMTPEAEIARRIMLIAARLRAFLNGQSDDPGIHPDDLSPPLAALVSFAVRRMEEGKP